MALAQAPTTDRATQLFAFINDEIGRRKKGEAALEGAGASTGGAAANGTGAVSEGG